MCAVVAGAKNAGASQGVLSMVEDLSAAGAPMRRALLVLSFLAALPILLFVLPALPALAAATPARGASAAMSEEEKAFCRDEHEMVEKRRRIFEAQGLSPAEVARKNEGAMSELADCRERFRAKGRRAFEEKEDLQELQRRAGPNATAVEREKAFREIRRERLGSKSPSSLTPEEKAELAAGMAEEMEATHAALDSAHARDPVFMRMIHSALACYHGERKEQVVRLIASEEAFLKLGTGDKLKLYSLRSQLRESEDVLARSREAARSFESGLERCSSSSVAIVTHCLARAFDGKRGESACESEEIQQYVRFVK